jgi:uncharacterized membrane protein
MSLQVKRAVARCAIFALMGLLLEVTFTWIVEGVARGAWNHHGHTCPLMVFDYGLMGILLMPIARPLIRAGVPLVLRAVVYMIAIFLVEYVSGWVFVLCDLKIWDYSELPWNLHGHITAIYIPLWYALGLAAEFLYRRVDMVSLALLRGVTVDQLEART